MCPLGNSNDDQRADSRVTFTGRLIGGGHLRHYRGRRYGQEREENHLGRTRLDGHGCRADRQHADRQRAESLSLGNAVIASCFHRANGAKRDGAAALRRILR